MSNFIDLFNFRSSSFTPETPPKADKPKYRLLSLATSKSRTFQGFSSLRSKNKKSRITTTALVKQSSSAASSAASEIALNPVTNAPSSPRKAISYDLSRESKAYTSPILEPESPLEGRHLKVGLAPAASKALTTEPLLFSPQATNQSLCKSDSEDNEMIYTDGLVLSTATAQSPTLSNASYYTARIFMPMDVTRQGSPELEEEVLLPVLQEKNPGPNILASTPEESPQRVLHIAQVLQRAAQQTRNQQVCTQSKAFRTIAPLLLFISVLVIGVMLPRNFATLERRFGTGCNIAVSILILGGLGCILLLLKGIIWVISVLGEAFCDMDLTLVLRQGECRGVDGTRMREGDLIVGNFLLG